jgi:hypothetical protein
LSESRGAEISLDEEQAEHVEAALDYMSRRA